MRPFLLALLITIPLAAADPPARTISVGARAVIALAPQGARWDLVVRTVHKQLAKARAENRAAVERLTAALQGAGIPAADIQRFAATQGEQWSHGSISTKEGYACATAMTVELRDPARLDQIQDLLAAEEVVAVQAMTYTRTDEPAQRAAMRAQALLAAREKATTMAATLGCTLGSPLRIVEEQEQGWMGNRFNVQVMNRGDDREATLGAVSVAANVSVEFELHPQ